MNKNKVYTIAYGILTMFATLAFIFMFSIAQQARQVDLIGLMIMQLSLAFVLMLPLSIYLGLVTIELYKEWKKDELNGEV